jgi:hypothetical protein
MLQVPLKLIPSQYLDRVKGKVSVREQLAHQKDLPEIVVDRLACDRSATVLNAVAGRDGLTLEQVKALLDYGRNNYDVRGKLFRNRTLSYEALKHILDLGHNDSELFANQNIKATEFPKIVMHGIAKERGSWTRTYIIRHSMSNEGVGSTALIALSEEIRKVHRDSYGESIKYLLKNETLTAKSVEWIWKKSISVMKASELDSVVNSVVLHPKVSDDFIDTILLSLKDSQLTDAKNYEFREGYLASGKVIQKISTVNANFSSFLAKHCRVEHMTQEIVGRVLDNGQVEDAFALLKRGLIENENMKERAIIAVIKDYDHVQELQELGLIRTEHVEMAAREGSWQLRRFAARSEMASEKTLKRLAVDNDNDVRRAVLENPKWEEIKDSVEYQKRVTASVDRLNHIVSRAHDVLDVADQDEWEKDYEISREFVQALRVLAKPEFKSFITSFASEEQRELMKDGVDTETLSILGQFFE